MTDLAKYNCPKCEGSDLYLGKIRVLRGVGGIFGNRQQEILVPFCRTCEVEATYTQSTLANEARKRKRAWWLVAAFLVLFLLNILGVFN